ncbi:MAG: ATP-dependent sacrificial sulfur transferase LarE [Oscillospiraceae bacterium]|nr:ATP-dependent sacrificial sulfur transferase LarE [Oscillospiraceae bacterium]
MTLQDFFTEHPRVALAFSGGADSSYLLWAGLRWAERIGVYYVKSPFQPAFEYRDALRLAGELGAELTVLEADPLCDPRIAANPTNRCYFCKKVIMSTIKAAAARDGFDLVLDGTNASDDISDRPGYKALGEEGVLSPLRLCGITKAVLREKSREAGLFTWNKPAYACLATRVPTGETITAEKLAAIEAGEDLLFQMGFTDFRLRTKDGAAKLQFIAGQHQRAEAQLDEIRAALRPYYSAVSLDPIPRERST